MTSRRRLQPTSKRSCQRKLAGFIERELTGAHPTMDVEHINAIGNQLADLTHRTSDLRGYL